MKAALEAWGSEMNLFHKGFAKESADPRVIAATLKKPGVVLKRAVGSTEPFSEHPHLPDDLPATAPHVPARMSSKKSMTKKTKPKAGTKIDEKVARKAALAYAKEERRLKRQRARDAAREKKHERSAKRRWLRPKPHCKKRSASMMQAPTQSKPSASCSIDVPPPKMRAGAN
jgi:hypothetical protein